MKQRARNIAILEDPGTVSRGQAKWREGTSLSSRHFAWPRLTASGSPRMGIFVQDESAIFSRRIAIIICYMNKSNKESKLVTYKQLCKCGALARIRPSVSCGEARLNIHYTTGVEPSAEAVKIAQLILIHY